MCQAALSAVRHLDRGGVLSKSMPRYAREGNRSGRRQSWATHRTDEGQGSERKINRRDFLDGVAISAAGLAAAAASPSLTGGGGRADRQPAAAARLLPAHRHRHRRRAGRRHPRRHAHRRAAEPAAPALDGGRAGHPPAARPRRRRLLRPRGRRRGRQRHGGRQAVPGPLRAGLEDPAGRPAPRLRRAFAPQRVPHSRTRWNGGDVVYARRARRHREPRLDRQWGTSPRTDCSTPGPQRAAGARHARVLRCQPGRGQLPRERQLEHPGRVRAASDAAVPAAGLGQGASPARSCGPSRAARPGGSSSPRPPHTRPRPAQTSNGSWRRTTIPTTRRTPSRRRRSATRSA